ncbi:site-2 protease family protein [Syntrophomonas palmitatica]|uniref:site-2 protease family protein n=1 Tax=Syntrophomonas palmitatica TaxID=402877 RepID=UPI0006D04283|nr:site-2 protease family protein [Syntrophomonas palmitatica]
MKLGKVAGIVIKINLLFLLLAGIYVYLGMGWEVLSITVSLMMHEMAHTLVAVFSRIRITEIELLPFGGQARIEDFTGLEPENEIYIALAGPLVSLSLAGLFYFLPVLYFAPYGRLLFNINLLLGLFNLLPALPLDGGRILRAVLSVRQGYKKATQTSARLGLLTAAALTVYGIYLSVGDLIGANYIVIGVFYSGLPAGNKIFSLLFHALPGT